MHASVPHILFALLLSTTLLIDVCTLFLCHTWHTYATPSLLILQLIPAAHPAHLFFLALALAAEAFLFGVNSAIALPAIALLIGTTLGLQRRVEFPPHAAVALATIMAGIATLSSAPLGAINLAKSYSFLPICANLMIVGILFLTLRRCGGKGDRSQMP